MAEYDEMLWKYPFLKFSSKFGTPPPSVPPYQEELTPPRYEVPDWLHPMGPPISAAKPPRYEVPDWLHPMGPPISAARPVQNPPSTFEETTSENPPEFAPAETATPTEPTQKTSWLDKPGVLENLRSIAEGLGNIHVPVAGDIIHKTQAPSPFIAENIREMIKKREDKLTTEDAKMLNKYIGEDIFTAGQDFNRVKTFMPMLYTSLQSKLAESRQLRSENFQSAEREKERTFRESLFSRSQESRNQRQEDLENEREARRRFQDRQKLEQSFETERGKQISSTSITGKAIQAIDSGNIANRLLNTSDNPVAIRGAMINLARGSRDVGTLSNQDMKAWEGRIGIPGFFDITVPQTFIGNFSPKQIRNMKETVSELQIANSGILEDEKSRATKSFYETHRRQLDTHGFGLEDVERIFSDIFKRETKSPGAISAPTAPSTTGKIKVHYTDKATGNVIQDEIDASYKDAFLNDKDLLDPGLD